LSATVKIDRHWDEIPVSHEIQSVHRIRPNPCRFESIGKSSLEIQRKANILPSPQPTQVGNLRNSSSGQPAQSEAMAHGGLDSFKHAVNDKLPVTAGHRTILNERWSPYRAGRARGIPLSELERRTARK
jgi:hypothetical protein